MKLIFFFYIHSNFKVCIDYLLTYILQQNSENVQNMELLQNTENNCHLTSPFDTSLPDPLSLHFTDAAVCETNCNRNDVQDQSTSENTSTLYPQQASTNLANDNSSDNFVTGNTLFVIIDIVRIKTKLLIKYTY